MKIARIAFLLAVSVTAGVVPARAELAYFSGGDSLSIRGHREEGDSLVLVLRGGGEVVCDRATIVRFAPDEVPYPEPPPAPTGEAVERAVELPVPYGDIIDRVSAQHHVDARLVRAMITVESGYQERARSRKGAMGLMQLMPSTARQLKVKNPFDPQQNVDAGVRHLKQLLESYDGDVRLTLAAYNAGAGAVARSSGVPHYAETQNYVKRITNLYYGGFDFSSSGASRDPVRVQRDARGVLYISNTE